MKNQGALAELGKDLVGLWLLATASICIALVVNQLRDHPLSLIYATKAQRMDVAVVKVAPTVLPAVEQSDHPQIISMPEFRELAENKKALILDARPEIFHRLGHVPGALSLPREDFENGYSKYKSLLEPNKDQPIAVYCSESNCEDSSMVADALVKLGYHRVMVFKGGWGEWTAAKLPQEGHQ